MGEIDCNSHPTRDLGPPRAPTIRPEDHWHLFFQVPSCFERGNAQVG
jgi:hypothetical protein